MSTKNKYISIITTAFLDYQGEDFLLGGNERYLYDLINIYESLGLKCTVYQPSVVEFNKHVSKSTEVIGIPFNKINSFSYIRLNKIFHNIAQKSLIYHYQSYFLAYPNCYKNSIGISHGVYWDEPIGNDWDTTPNYFEVMKHKLKKNTILNRYMKACKSLEIIVANDTNFINWSRMSWPEIVSKITYIPNYVDLNYYSFKKEFVHKDNLTVLFARRLSKERGFALALKVAKDILTNYKNVKFIFTGPEPDYMKSFFQDTYDRVIFKEAPFNEMDKLYKEADISIIPTLHSEGTSFTCLESMASQLPIIASNVGGLGNLIIDGFNGILINPNEKVLENALEL